VASGKFLVPILLAGLLLCGCAHREAAVHGEIVRAAPLSPDSEQVQVRRDGVSDEAPLRELTLLRIAQDCLARGYKTFGFTSVAQAKPHLPNRPPDAPMEFFRTQTFEPPRATLPDVQPGTRLTVKFFKQDDPTGANGMDAALTVAILTATR
jgi:hypothetical protein